MKIFKYPFLREEKKKEEEKKGEPIEQQEISG